MHQRKIVVERGLPPPPPQDNFATGGYPWADLGPPRTIVDEDGTERVEMDSFFVPIESKNASSTVGKARLRHPEWDFEWRRVEELYERPNDDGVVGMHMTRGVRFWRTK